MPGTLVSIGLKTLRTLSGDVVLGVPEVEVAGAALEVDHDDALGLAPAGRPPLRLASAAEAAWSWSIEPSDSPSRPEPPTRRKSRRVMPRCGSHRSLPLRSGDDEHRDPRLFGAAAGRWVADRDRSASDQWLNRNAGLLIRAQAMSWAAVSRRASSWLRAHRQVGRGAGRAGRPRDGCSASASRWRSCDELRVVRQRLAPRPASLACRGRPSTALK